MSTVLSLNSLDYKVSAKLHKVTGEVDLYGIGYGVLEISKGLIGVDGQVVVTIDGSRLNIVVGAYNDEVEKVLTDPRDYINVYRGLLKFISDYRKRLKGDTTLYIEGLRYDIIPDNYDLSYITRHTAVILLVHNEHLINKNKISSNEEKS